MTKLFDAVGNEITAGAFMFWLDAKVPVRCIKIEPLSEAEGGDPKRPQGKIIIELGFTFDASGKKSYMTNFVITSNPAATRAVEELMKGVGA